ncbi:unnamed protein product, partial [Prorocentrum cordatum]
TVRGFEDELRAAGAVVDIERRIPELYQIRPDGSICQAKRYGDAVHSVAVEAGGRVSEDAATVIVEFAAASRLHGRPLQSGRRDTTACAFGERISTIVMLGCARATLA